MALTLTELIEQLTRLEGCGHDDLPVVAYYEPEVLEIDVTSVEVYDRFPEDTYVQLTTANRRAQR